MISAAKANDEKKEITDISRERSIRPDDAPYKYACRMASAQSG